MTGVRFSYEPPNTFQAKVAKWSPKPQDNVRFIGNVQMEINDCRIGQAQRCCSTGCEWRKAFGLRKSTLKCTPGHPIKIKEKTKIDNTTTSFKKVSNENTFKILKQDDWLKKIKVKL